MTEQIEGRNFAACLCGRSANYGKGGRWFCTFCWQGKQEDDRQCPYCGHLLDENGFCEHCQR